jgi:hypothetical protein
MSAFIKVTRGADNEDRIQYRINVNYISYYYPARNHHQNMGLKTALVYRTGYQYNSGFDTIHIRESVEDLDLILKTQTVNYQL